MARSKGLGLPGAVLGVAALLVVAALIAGVGPFSVAGGGDKAAQQSWNEYKDLVGFEFPSRTASENVVLVDSSVQGTNVGSPDVATVGADTDEADETELLTSSDVEASTDYFSYSTFGSQITSNLPNNGDYKLAVIGSGIVNKYIDYTVPKTVSQFRVKQGNPLKPYTKSPTAYAADADVTVGNTKVVDDGDTIALSTDYSTNNADSNVDGSVTGVRKYDIADGVAAQFGDISVSSVNGNVTKITVTVMADGRQIASASDSDFSDSNGLSDKVDIDTSTAEDSVTVETSIQFEDAQMSSAANLATVTLDDSDNDGDSSDGSYGIPARSITWTGY